MLGGQSNGVYQAKIIGSSIDNGYAHIVITSVRATDSFCVEVSESSSKNMNNARHPTKVLIGYEGATGGVYAHYICGSGKAYYYIETSTKIHFILAPDTNIDYSGGFVLSTRTINTAENVNRNGFNISIYTEMTVYNNSFNIPDFYKSYSDLSSLASALGGVKAIALSGTEDMDDLKDVTKEYIARYDSAARTIAHSPFVNSFYCDVIRTGSNIYIQRATNFTGQQMYRVCTSNVWGEWTTVSIDTPLFYNSYSDLSSLASALGGVKMAGSLQNASINSVTDFTIYSCVSSHSVTDFPGNENAGYLITAPTKGYLSAFQIFIGLSGGTSYIRTNSNRTSIDTTKWGAWSEITIGLPSFYKSYSDLSSLASALGVGKIHGKAVSSSVRTDTFIDNSAVILVFAYWQRGTANLVDTCYIYAIVGTSVHKILGTGDSSHEITVTRDANTLATTVSIVSGDMVYGYIPFKP